MGRLLKCKKLVTPNKLKDIFVNMDDIKEISPLTLRAGEKMQECLSLHLEKEHIIIDTNWETFNGVMDDTDPNSAIIDLTHIETFNEGDFEGDTEPSEYDPDDPFDVPIHSVLIYVKTNEDHTTDSPYTDQIHHEILFCKYDLNADEVKKIIIVTNSTINIYVDSYLHDHDSESNDPIVEAWALYESPYNYNGVNYGVRYYEIVIKGIGGRIFEVTEDYLMNNGRVNLDSVRGTSVKDRFIPFVQNSPAGSTIWVKNYCLDWNDYVPVTISTPQVMGRIKYWCNYNNTLKEMIKENGVGWIWGPTYGDINSKISIQLQEQTKGLTVGNNSPPTISSDSTTPSIAVGDNHATIIK